VAKFAPYHVRGTMTFSQHVEMWDLQIGGSGLTGWVGNWSTNNPGTGRGRQYRVTSLGGTIFYQGDAAVVPDAPKAAAGYVCVSEPEHVSKGMDLFSPGHVLSTDLRGPGTTITAGRVTTVDGVRVIPVHFAPPGDMYPLDLFLAADGPPHLVAVSSEGIDVHYSDWNQPVHIAAPSPCSVVAATPSPSG
jgi:hypothetical protein